jgi:hypothetical protein
VKEELFILRILAGAMQFLDGFIGQYQHHSGKIIWPCLSIDMQKDKTV